MHILISPNAFKNSVSATEAGMAILEGLRSSGLGFSYELFPVGDGGDGTGELLVERLGGRFVNCLATDPRGMKRQARYGLIENDSEAVIEMAEASGLRLLAGHSNDPLTATSFGTGELILDALNHNVRRIYIAMGGSATVDGGTGILRALGVEFYDTSGNQLEHIRDFATLHRIDWSHLHPRVADTEFIILCDVKNRLCGHEGAAAVFGPQKGASASDIEKLEEALRIFALCTKKQTSIDLLDLPAAGAAGGAAAGLFAYLKARLADGIGEYLRLTGYDQALRHADYVITGEGSLDEQTLQGKAPFGIASLAHNKGIPVIALTGQMPLNPSTAFRNCFPIVFPVGHSPFDPETVLGATLINLQRTSASIGALLKSASYHIYP